MARKAHGKKAARKARGRETDDLRKHLSADALFTLVSGGFGRIADYRPPDGSVSLHDALMSAFAMFSLKDPSLLAFDQRRNDENLKALYHIENIPSDTHLRTILDPVDPESLRPLFKDVFRQLQRGKALEPFVFYEGCYLLSLDGTGYFSSRKIHCASCTQRSLVQIQSPRPTFPNDLSSSPEPLRLSGGEGKCRSPGSVADDAAGLLIFLRAVGPS